MTFEEWRLAAKHLKIMYPSERFMPKEDYVKIWYQYLSDIEFIYVKMAIESWISCNSFYPTVSDIRNTAVMKQKENKAKLNELKDIYKTCKDYYPRDLITEDDWQTFKDCIRSEQFEDAKTKALMIKSRIMNTRVITKSFKEYINEIGRTEYNQWSSDK